MVFLDFVDFCRPFGWGETLKLLLFVDLQEILDEVVRELHKVKDEIIYGKQCIVTRLIFNTSLNDPFQINLSLLKFQPN